MMEEQKYNHLQMICIVFLRVVIGWHFLYEGVYKFMKTDWSASGYLKASKGPLAGVFAWMANTTDVLTVVNFLNMWGLTLIGLGLILGFFTRFSAICGALMVLLFYMANPPFIGYFSSTALEGNYLIVNKNLVEIAGLLVIAVTYSGRYLGFDRILHRLFSMMKSPKEKDLTSATA
jgi:thiosulfate dehydrogenase (quinone) large subunit